MSRRTARTTVVAAATGLMLLTGVGAAFADDCVNVSRSTRPTPGGSTLSTGFGDVQVKGHWVNLGDVWLFVSPGTQSLDGIDVSALPGANGNFSGANGIDDLLGVQASKGGKACQRDSFGTHGIASACGAEGP